MIFPENFVNQIVCGDCLELMKMMPDNSVDLVVCSPPYNTSKSYKTYSDNLPIADYHDWLRKACREMYRLIKPNCNVFVNICDVGISNRDAVGEHKIGNRGNFYVVPNHVIVIQEMINLNAQYLNPIIWRKPSNCKTQFGCAGRLCGSYPVGKNCHIPSCIEYILRFRKNGINQKIPRDVRDKSIVPKERWLELSNQIWEFNGVSAKEHPCVYPLELPTRCIEGWSLFNDIVLDPFVGIGTTAIAAIKLGRRYIGLDISHAYCELARRHIEQAAN